jgi:hypothetical protein
MDPMTLRISIELPAGTVVDVGTGTGSAAGPGQAIPDRAGPIDAGPPAAAIVAALGDPDVPAPAADARAGMGAFDGPDGMRSIGGDGAIDAGGFPVELAAAMEAEGPRQPMGRTGHTRATTALSPVVSPESRN